VAAAPWEPRAFFVPDVMCPRLVARRGRHTTRRSRRLSARSSWLLPGSSTRSSYPPRCARVWSLGAGDALSAQVVRRVLLWLHPGSSACVVPAVSDVHAIGRGFSC
jgi:hypothetical protein